MTTPEERRAELSKDTPADPDSPSFHENNAASAEGDGDKEPEEPLGNLPTTTHEPE